MNDRNYFRKELRKIVNSYGEDIFLDAHKFYAIISDHLLKGAMKEKYLFHRLIDTSLFENIYRYKDDLRYLKKEIISLAGNFKIDLMLLLSFSEDLLFALDRKVDFSKIEESNDDDLDGISRDISDIMLDSFSIDELMKLGNENFKDKQFKEARPCIKHDTGSCFLRNEDEIFRLIITCVYFAKRLICGTMNNTAGIITIKVSSDRR